MDLLLLLVMTAVSLCSAVVCYPIAKRKGRGEWLWCILGFLFSVFALGLLLLLPPTAAVKRLQDMQGLDELEAYSTEAQQFLDDQPVRHAPGGQLGTERADDTRIQALLTTFPIDESREVATLAEKLRMEQEFLELQQKFGDEAENVVETQNRIDALKRQINAKYDQETSESTADLEQVEPETAEPEAAADLKQVDANEFETLVARLYERLGYDVASKPRSRDGGMYLYARRTGGPGADKIVVDCKHYYVGVIGAAAARALYVVVSAEHRLARGVLVTSGSFSAGCRSFVEGKRIELIDGARLRELLEHYEVR